MGNRLSKIYTRTGDEGTTGLGNGERVAKDATRVEAYGTVDELNSCIGLLMSSEKIPTSIHTSLLEIQHDLFDLGGELCIPGFELIKPEFTARLESTLDELNADLPALKDFILPSGGEASARCHIARTVCRRAERRIWTLIQEVKNSEKVIDKDSGEEQAQVNLEGAKYLNRLSDLLFVMARVIVREENGDEVIWKRGKLNPKN